MKQKFRFEGFATAGSHLAVCMRVETGGVPRFETLLVPWSQIDEDGRHRLSEAIRFSRDQGQPAPWVTDPIPGIDSGL